MDGVELVVEPGGELGAAEGRGVGEEIGGERGH
jgi:hypothetical protein